MTERIGVAGLGRMGLAMARTLTRAGLAPLGYDISAEARARADQAGIATATSGAELVVQSSIIVASLPDDTAVRDLVGGEGGIIAVGDGQRRLLIDTSTIEPATSRDLAEQLSAAGHAMLDAPVSGGPAGAEAGTLTMLIGGSEAALERAAPVLDALAGRIVHVGESGAGHAAKLVNNLLCAAHLVTNGEAMRLARAAGVAPERVLDAVNAASGRSAVSEVNLPRWILSGSFDSGFTMGLMRKDVRLALKLMDATGETAPLSRHVASIWADSADDLPDSADFNRIAALSYGEH